MIIVLNLERAPDRKDLLKEQFNKLKMTEGEDYIFWPGFDGNHILNASIQVPIVTGVGLGRKLEKAEIAIIMTHLSALKHAQVMGYKEVIILEDDVVLCEDWKHRINLIHGYAEDWEYIYLSGHSDYVELPKGDSLPKMPVLIPAPMMVGAFSYMVHPDALPKLIKYCSQIVTTFDDMITLKIKAGKLKGFVYMPFMTYHNAKTSYIWGVTSQNHSSKERFKNNIND